MEWQPRLAAPAEGEESLCVPLSCDRVRAGGGGGQRSAGQQRSTEEGRCQRWRRRRCGEADGEREGEGQVARQQQQGRCRPAAAAAAAAEGNSRLLVRTQKACRFSVMCSSSICRLGRMKSLSNSSGAARRLSPALPACSTSGVESPSRPPPPPLPRDILVPEPLPSLHRKPRGSSGAEVESGEPGRRSSSRGLWARLES